MTEGLPRRRLLRLAAAAGLGLAALMDADRVRVAARVEGAFADRPVRPRIGSAAAARHLASFRRAVAAMRALPTSDPRNWTRQAQLHNEHGPHASWLFLPWHRAYLFCFESICRELSGDSAFALPYWDWSSDPSIPAEFFEAPLSYEVRDASRSVRADPAFVGAGALAAILDEPNFLVMGGPAATEQYGPGYGLVEQGPHHHVHGLVGGTMGTLMSPLDPIFWAHHGRLDRLWVEWNLDRDHPLPDSDDWWRTEFTEFVDGTGRPVRVSMATVALMPLVAYRYDTQAAR